MAAPFSHVCKRGRNEERGQGGNDKVLLLISI